MELDFENMNLDEAFGSDFPDEGSTGTPAQEQTPEAGDPETQEGETTPPPQADAKPETEQGKPKNWNPEGPGKPSAALREAREKERVAREEARQYQERLAEYERREAEARHAQEQAAFAAQLETLAIEDC